MKPARFDYLSAADIAGTVSLLAEGAKPMAGNQSLGPMLNLRLARPGNLANAPEPQIDTSTVWAMIMAVGV